MVKRDMGRHALADAESKRGQMHNARGKVLGWLMMLLVSGKPKRSGDNMFTVLSGSKHIEGRIHTAVGGGKGFTLHEKTEPSHMLLLRGLKGDEPKDGVLELAVWGLTKADCLLTGHPIEYKGKPTGRYDVRVTATPRYELGLIQVPERFLNIATTKERDAAMAQISRMTATEKAQIIDPITYGNVREFLTDGAEQATQHIPAALLHSLPTDDETAAKDNGSITTEAVDDDSEEEEESEA